MLSAEVTSLCNAFPIYIYPPPDWWAVTGTEIRLLHLHAVPLKISIKFLYWAQHHYKKKKPIQLSPIIYWYPPSSLPLSAHSSFQLRSKMERCFNDSVSQSWLHTFSEGWLSLTDLTAGLCGETCFFFLAFFKIIFGSPATEGQTKWRRTGEFRAEKLMVKERKCEGVWEIAFSLNIFTREIKNSNTWMKIMSHVSRNILTSYWLFLPHMWMKVSTWEIYIFTFHCEDL